MLDNDDRINPIILERLSIISTIMLYKILIEDEEDDNNERRIEKEFLSTMQNLEKKVDYLIDKIEKL